MGKIVLVIGFVSYLRILWDSYNIPRIDSNEVDINMYRRKSIDNLNKLIILVSTVWVCYVAPLTLKNLSGNLVRDLFTIISVFALGIAFITFDKYASDIELKVNILNRELTNYEEDYDRNFNNVMLLNEIVLLISLLISNTKLTLIFPFTIMKIMNCMLTLFINYKNHYEFKFRITRKKLI